MTASRTVNPLHFEDLEPHRFEDLVRQLAHGFRPWRSLEATGRLGRDEGVDIRGTELRGSQAPRENDETADEESDPQEPGDEVVWVIQCKRAKTFAAADARRVVGEAVPDGSDPPYGLIIAVATDASTEAVVAFHEAARARGVTESHLWTKAHLEDSLFRPENDHLLFAYFGLSLVSRRRGHLADLRSQIALKRKMLRAFSKDKVTDTLFDPAVIRDIGDQRYPYSPKASEPPQRWRVVSVEQFHPRGLIVLHSRHQGWVKPDGTWDLCAALREPANYLENEIERSHSPDDQQAAWDKRTAEKIRYESLVPEGERVSIFERRFIPFDALVEVDPMGDPWYPVPHLFVREDTGPWAGNPFYASRDILTAGGETELDNDKRRELFAASAAPKRALKTKPKGRRKSDEATGPPGR